MCHFWDNFFTVFCIIVFTAQHEISTNLSRLSTLPKEEEGPGARLLQSKLKIDAIVIEHAASHCNSGYGCTGGANNVLHFCEKRTETNFHKRFYKRNLAVV